MAGGAKFRLTAPHGSEAELHASVAHMLDWMLLPPALYTTFPAGGYLLTKAAAGQLRRKGLKAGMPDLFAFFDGQTVGIELKVGNNGQTPLQQEMAIKLRAAGIPVHVCRSLEDVIDVLKIFKFPLRPGFSNPRYGSGAAAADVSRSQMPDRVSPDQRRMPDDPSA